MTPIEAMARAHWHRRDDVEGFMPWEELQPETRASDVADMRAALLALCEVELPEEAKIEGAKEMTSDPEAIRLYSRAVTRPFRAVLRSIASESPEGQTTVGADG